MTRPDASKKHRPDPKRTRALVAATGMTYAQLAERLGVSVRSLERWLGEMGRIPYPEQYALEALARQAGKARGKFSKPLVAEPPRRAAAKPPLSDRQEPKRRPHPLAGRLPKDTP